KQTIFLLSVWTWPALCCRYGRVHVQTLHRAAEPGGAIPPFGETKKFSACATNAPVFFWLYELAQSRSSGTKRRSTMGLDMYAYITDQDIPAVDFSEPRDARKICYWRKHPNLHGWMEKLYRAKGGEDDGFNLAPVKLDEADIKALE